MMKLNHLFPLRCIYCGRNICYNELPMCGSCISHLQELMTERCKNCDKTASSCQCPDKRDVRFAFFYRSFASKRLIYIIKNHVDVDALDFFAELAVDTCGINPSRYDGVAYVPRSPQNLRRIGYDQAEELAKAISRRYGIPVISALCRVGNREQKLLSRAERMKSVKSKYRVKEEYNTDKKYNKILLVDDVYTTGATIRVCAELLRGTVSRAVVPFTLAKTNLRKK